MMRSSKLVLADSTAIMLASAGVLAHSLASTATAEVTFEAEGVRGRIRLAGRRDCVLLRSRRTHQAKIAHGARRTPPPTRSHTRC